MEKTELTDFIKHYLEKDKTKSAIMLIGGWGTGKSHYIKNELVPALKENGTSRCVTISLYGLKTVSDVSKSIYLELRTKILQPEGETATTGKLVAKTVAKGITSFFGIDLSTSEEEMQKLYESINLSGKLIVLEDVERSQINIFELLGYINSLVEQDGVKLLLIANENELIEYEPIKEENPEKQDAAELLDKLSDHKNRRYTEKSQKYLAIKEKTVSDTILFEGDYASAVEQIIHDFENPTLSSIVCVEFIKQICDTMKSKECNNLRSFIFACQKAVDIYSRINLDPSSNTDFIETIFYGILIFSLRYKAGGRLSWEGGQSLSVALGSEKYPLFRFCYDYIVLQHFNVELAATAKTELETYRLYDKRKSQDDKDLLMIYGYYRQSEQNVIQAVENITNHLEEQGYFAFQEYGRIAVYLVIVHYQLGCDISKAKKLLVKNLYNKGNTIRADYMFTVSIDRENESHELIEELDQLKGQMIASLNAKEETIFDFDYNPSSISEFSIQVGNNERLILEDKTFASRLSASKIIEMLEKCSASQIEDFRSVFMSVYRSSNIRDFLSDDKPYIDQLLEVVNGLQKYGKYDKIQKLQIGWFTQNLKEILGRL